MHKKNLLPESGREMGDAIGSGECSHRFKQCLQFFQIQRKRKADLKKKLKGAMFEKDLDVTSFSHVKYTKYFGHWHIYGQNT